ncbi:MAG: UvrB/UvrC motif-containing protein [Elusimicrobiota bacterium]|nr:UvrB/UvrC motif-containing protein [Elusimicrobiota bacterium]
MICDICKENEATVHFTSFHGGEVTKMHICHACAVKLGVFDGNTQEKSFDILGKFLSALALPESISDQSCSECGKKLSEFREDGKLGCPQCWEAFRANLEPLLKKIHGRSFHKGKAGAPKVKNLRVGALQKELLTAVEKEEYEEAARIRDKIKELKKGGGK